MFVFFFFLFLYIIAGYFILACEEWKLTCSPSSEGNYWLIKEMYSHDGVYLHSNATWLVENNLNCDSFVPRWPNQSCVSLLSSSSIYYWLAFNICKSDTRGSRLKSTFCCNASLNMNKRINLEVIKDTTITLPSRILAMQIIL